jgi:hypothetical protein
LGVLALRGGARILGISRIRVNHHCSIAFKIFPSETCQTCDEWITEDADGIRYAVRLHQLNSERACAVMTDENKITV